MHPLQKWLESEQNFEEGNQLYSNHGGLDTWSTLFESLGESTFTRVKLFEVVNELLKAIEAKYAAPIPENEPKPPPTPRRLADAEDAPIIIKKTIESRKDNYKRANQLHHLMVVEVENRLMGKPAMVDLKETVYELRDRFEVIENAWEVENHYNATKEVPIEREIKPIPMSTDYNHLSDRRRSLITYLSPSYLKRIPEKRREEFKANTQREIDDINNLLTENESIIQLR